MCVLQSVEYRVVFSACVLQSVEYRVMFSVCYRVLNIE